MAEGIITRRGGGVPSVVATGGTVTDIEMLGGVTYRVHTFTSDGTFEVTRGGEVEVFVQGGGGGGGTGSARFADGAGGGGFVRALFTVPVGSTAIVVGSGGAPFTGCSTAGNSIRGATGGTSSFATIEGLGGQGSAADPNFGAGGGTVTTGAKQVLVAQSGQNGQTGNAAFTNKGGDNGRRVADPFFCAWGAGAPATDNAVQPAQATGFGNGGSSQNSCQGQNPQGGSAGRQGIVIVRYRIG